MKRTGLVVLLEFCSRRCFLKVLLRRVNDWSLDLVHRETSWVICALDIMQAFQ